MPDQTPDKEIPSFEEIEKQLGPERMSFMSEMSELTYKAGYENDENDVENETP